MRLLRLGLPLALSLVWGAYAQTLTTATLTGQYFARHVEFTTDANNNVTDARSIVGTVTFSGSGQYTFSGQQVVGTAAAANYSVSGTYSMSTAGLVTISNPQKPTLNINARYAVEAVIGASTEAIDNTFDMFVAIPASGSRNNSGLNGTYYAADFELPFALTSQVRDSIVNMAMDGAGNITSFATTSHAANFGNGAIISELAMGGGGTYSVSANTLTFPPGTLLNSAARTMAVSTSGNVILAGTPGAHDILIGVKAFSGTAANTSLAPSFWLGGLRLDTVNGGQSLTGSGETINGVSITSTERLHEAGPATLNRTESQSYTVAADGTGSYGAAKIGLGTGGNLMVTANLSAELDPTGYAIGFAALNPTLTGPSVFINPRGIVNAASGAPGVDSISPGEFIAIYGSGLAPKTVSSLPPYPPMLGQVTVSIGGLPAPLYFVSSGQIDCLVPYAVTGTSVTVTVTNNGVASNAVTVPLAKTSPGIFSQDTSGTGDAAILHFSTGTIVNAASPAVKGEIVELYLTGLGPLTTPIPDGTGATTADFAVTPIAIYVDAVAVPASGLLYAGVSSLPGLYQINFKVPTNLTVTGELPLAILTPDAFHDQVNIAVQ